MRLALTLIAVAMFGTSLWSHAWAKTRDPFFQVELGLFSIQYCDLQGCRTDELHELAPIDRTGENEATVCFYAGLVAAAAIALTISRRPLPILARVALGAPMIVSFGATVVFMERLGRVRSMDLSWAPFASLVAALLGLALLVVPAVAPTADPATATRRAPS